MCRSIRLLMSIALTAVAVSVASCSSKPKAEKLPETGATLEGTVTYNGTQLEFAMILVQGPNGAATGNIGDDGRYKVENVPLGPVKIGVNTSAARGQYQSKLMSNNAAAADPEKSKKIAQPKFVDVKPTYFDPETSGLTRTIEKGANTFDITLP